MSINVITQIPNGVIVEKNDFVITSSFDKEIPIQELVLKTKLIFDTEKFKAFNYDDAKKILITDYKEYGVTEEELDEYAKRNEGDELHSAENLTFMVLVTTSLKSGGVEKSTSSKTTPYYGYSNETVFDAVNMNSGNYATFNVVD